MQVSATMHTTIDSLTSVEEILDYCARALYDRYPSYFLTTGINENGADIRSQQIEHWAGARLVGENIAEEQIYIAFLSAVDKNHKQSATPWTFVSPIGASTDTPNGIFA